MDFVYLKNEVITDDVCDLPECVRHLGNDNGYLVGHAVNFAGDEIDVYFEIPDDCDDYSNIDYTKGYVVTTEKGFSWIDEVAVYGSNTSLMQTLNPFAIELKKLMLDYHISNKALAAKLGMDCGNLSRKINNSNLTISQFLDIAKAIGLTETEQFNLVKIFSATVYQNIQAKKLAKKKAKQD